MNHLTANKREKELKKMWGLWWIFFLSPAFSAMVCHLINATREPILSPDFPSYILKFALYIICGLLLILSFYVRNRISISKKDSNCRQNAELSNTNSTVNKYAGAVIWSLAIPANMSLLGFGMFLLTKDFQSLYIVIAIATVAIIYHRPKEQELENIISAIKNNQSLPNQSPAKSTLLKSSASHHQRSDKFNMEDEPTTYPLKKKGIYYFLTKHIMLLTFCLIIFLLLIESVSSGNIMIFRLVIAIGFFGIFFLLLQLGLSRTSPHKVEIFSDKVKFVGPWGFGKNTIHFHQISAIAYNENTFMISPKWPGFCNVTIRPSLDPEKEIRKELFNKLQGNPKIKFVKNNHL